MKCTCTEIWSAKLSSKEELAAFKSGVSVLVAKVYQEQWGIFLSRYNETWIWIHFKKQETVESFKNFIVPWILDRVQIESRISPITRFPKWLLIWLLAMSCIPKAPSWFWLLIIHKFGNFWSRLKFRVTWSRIPFQGYFGSNVFNTLTYKGYVLRINH